MSMGAASACGGDFVSDRACGTLAADASEPEV
jgi:hypothetical protein